MFFNSVEVMEEFISICLSIILRNDSTKNTPEPHDGSKILQAVLFFNFLSKVLFSI